VESQYGVVRLGETRELRERFFAISVERQISHPAVRAVSEGAQGGLFAASKTTVRETTS
jgi:LysR family transcriptional activator of nhaA